MTEISPADEPPLDDAGSPGKALDPGIGLCMSGGGFRAMLFHTGVLWRLNQAGLLGKVTRSSSVSGGSLVNGVLALAWPKLTWVDGIADEDDFRKHVAKPVMDLAERRVDVWAGVTGLFVPGLIGRRLVGVYRRRLFGGTTLGKLAASGPRFTFCATDVRSGHLWYHERDRIGEYASGFFALPDYPLADAVAASSAFPPFLSPVVARLSKYGSVPDAYAEPRRLCDGGVYDNLGLQPVEGKHATVIVADAGSPFATTRKLRKNWGSQLIDTTELIDAEVRRLRRSHFVGRLRAAHWPPGDTQPPGLGPGAYIGIDTDIADFAADSQGGLPFDDPMDAPRSATQHLAAIKTRLAPITATDQQRLINWGYAVCDAAIRKYVLALPKGTFPFPETGVG